MIYKATPGTTMVIEIKERTVGGVVALWDVVFNDVLLSFFVAEHSAFEFAERLWRGLHATHKPIPLPASTLPPPSIPTVFEVSK